MAGKRMGRPPMPEGRQKVQINVRVDPDICAFMKEHGGYVKLIEAAIPIWAAAHGLEIKSPSKP